VLEYLADLPGSAWTSIESGCGYTTVVLASTFGTHICVNPDLSSNRLVREFIERHVGTTGLRHVEMSSDQGLPALVAEGVRVDLALIDGNHTHPFPLLDFHYMDQMLASGGRLLVDNLEIEAVQELIDFLEVEPAFRLERLIGNCGVFRKVEERVFGWKSQTLKRRSPEVEVARREIAQLRMEVAPDLRAALSGATLLQADRNPSLLVQTSLETSQTEARDDVEPSGDEAPGRPGPDGTKPTSGNRSERKASRLVKWYLTPSGAVLALALLLLGVGFVASTPWNLAGVIGVILMALFFPYRSVREQRRTDDRIRGLLRNDVRPGLSKLRAELKREIRDVRASSDGLRSDLARQMGSVTAVIDYLDQGLRDLRDDVEDSREARLEIADRLSQLAAEASNLHLVVSELEETLKRGGRANGFRARLSSHTPEMHHEQGMASLLRAMDDGPKDDPSSA
jgi:hypothetical protein